MIMLQLPNRRMVLILQFTCPFRLHRVSPWILCHWILHSSVSSSHTGWHSQAGLPEGESSGLSGGTLSFPRDRVYLYLFDTLARDWRSSIGEQDKANHCCPQGQTHPFACSCGRWAGGESSQAGPSPHRTVPHEEPAILWRILCLPSRSFSSTENRQAVVHDLGNIFHYPWLLFRLLYLFAWSYQQNTPSILNSVRCRAY